MQNPADHASHGLGIVDSEGQTSTWAHGPIRFYDKKKPLDQSRTVMTV